MLWPQRAGVPFLEPGRDLGKFLGGGSQGDAVIQIFLAIAEREELGSEQIEASEGHQLKSLACEKGTGTLHPARRQIPGEACGTIVEPVPPQGEAGCCWGTGKVESGGLNGGWYLGMEAVDVVGRALDNLHQDEGRAADDDAREG